MADIVVDTYKLKYYAQRIDAVNRRISRLDRRMNGLYTQVNLRDLHRLLQADALTGYSWRLRKCRDYLQQTAADFDRTEQMIRRTDSTSLVSVAAAGAWNQLTAGNEHIWPDGLVEAQLLARKALTGQMVTGIAVSSLALIKPPFWEAFWSGSLTFEKKDFLWFKGSDETYVGALGYKASGGFTPAYGIYKDDELLGDEDHLNLNRDQTKIKDPKKQVNPDENWYSDPKATILEAKGEAKIEGSVLDMKAQGDCGWAQGSAEAKVLTAEAHAEAAVGLYVYTKDKDGNTVKVFSPGVKAEVGASVAVVQVEAEGRIGLGEDNNMLGVYGDVEAEALSAEAKGEVAFNAKEVYAGASAEANLVKVSGSGGVSVLGTDVGVSGSLKVGVGAHAEIGYTDGKFKVDVGAAIGVGVDVGFEVDVSGTVDAVTDVASSAIEGVQDAWEGAQDVASDVLEGAKDVASDVVDGAKDAVSDIWKGAKNAWKSLF